MLFFKYSEYVLLDTWNVKCGKFIVNLSDYFIQPNSATVKANTYFRNYHASEKWSPRMDIEWIFALISLSPFSDLDHRIR